VQRLARAAQFRLFLAGTIIANAALCLHRNRLADIGFRVCWGTTSSIPVSASGHVAWGDGSPNAGQNDAVTRNAIKDKSTL
jgi:hypothetical protein